MARLSAVVLTNRGEDSNLVGAIAAAAGEHGVGFEPVIGDFDAVLERVAAWVVLPEIIILDIPEGMTGRQGLEKLGEHLPEGEAQVILVGVENEIRVYRELREMGVVEIFDDAPTEAEIGKVLELLVSRQANIVGIDPRRVVYVWSACGGAGGSMHAMAFARYFATEGRRTLFIDLDLATAPASMFFAAERGARETPGLIDALSNPHRIDALFLERTIQPAGKNLFYLSARQRDGDDLLPAAVPALIARAQLNFDMIVVDTPWRASPAPDYGQVYGPSYIVAPPTPAGLLGFTLIARDLALGPSKAPVFGVLNRYGEFKGNDISLDIFKGEFDGEILLMPYDAAALGRLFYDQKTLVDVGGKIAKSVQKVLGSLKSAAVEGSARQEKKKKGLFGRG